MLTMSRERYEVLYELFKKVLEEGEPCIISNVTNTMDVIGDLKPFDNDVKKKCIANNERNQLIELGMLIEKTNKTQYTTKYDYILNKDYVDDYHPQIDEDLLKRKEEIALKIYPLILKHEHYDGRLRDRDIGKATGLTRKQVWALETIGLIRILHKDSFGEDMVVELCDQQKWGDLYIKKRDQERKEIDERNFQRSIEKERRTPAARTFYWIVVAIVLLPIAFFTNKGFPQYFECLAAIIVVIIYLNRKKNDEIDDRIKKHEEEKREKERAERERDNW